MIDQKTQDLITLKAQLRLQEMMRRWMKEYYGNRLGVMGNGEQNLYGEAGRQLDENSLVGGAGLQASDRGESGNLLTQAGYSPENTPNINPESLV